MNVSSELFASTTEHASELFLHRHSPTLRYHGPQHPVNVNNYFKKELDYLAENDIEFSELSVIKGIYANFGHDIDQHLPLEPYYFDLEARSARETYVALRNAELDEYEVALPSAVLIGTTRPLAPCVTLNQKVMRRNDVGNLADTDEVFNSATDDLYAEHLFMCPEPMSYAEWFDKACHYALVPLLSADLSFGHFDRGQSGKSRFQERAFENIDKKRENLGLKPIYH